MCKLPEKLHQKLTDRKQQNAFRTLESARKKIDFLSNDYIGFARDNQIHSKSIEIVSNYKTINGSTGSRLVSGTSELHIATEKKLAKFFNAPSGLLYNSGYDANLGLLSAILQKGDTIIYDELIHASIRDGMRLSLAKSYKFKHNNIASLEKLIKKTSGTVYVIVESVYSMDGDSAPLAEIVDLCEKHNAYLIVDEAHGLGVFGPHGRGLTCELNLEDKIFARICTFGKALGCHGAVILGAKELIDFLINFSRSFIYTTAMPLHNVATIATAIDLLENTVETIKLKSNITYFKEKIKKSLLENLFIESDSAIHCCIISGNDKVKEIATDLQQKGLDIKPILSPTVPLHQERLRICLHSYNTKEEINLLTSALENTLK